MSFHTLDVPQDLARRSLVESGKINHAGVTTYNILMEIIYIPDKAPIPPDQQPTVEVFAASIQPKLVNTLIRRLNQIAPFESLRHVKRVKKHQPTKGNTELWVILCLVSSQNSDGSFPLGVQELITSHKLTVFRTEVSKYAATSKEEWEEQCKLWPTSFHPPTYNIDGITGFSDEDSVSILSFMNIAIQLAKSGGSGSFVNAAVIVDPSVKEVISRARDETLSTNETRCLKQQESDLEGAACCETVQSNDGLPNQTKEPFSGVSCLFPRRWAVEEQPHSSSRQWHPLRHAANVAIEFSAARDRHLFPNSSEVQKDPTDVYDTKSSFVGSPLKKQKVKSNGVDLDPITTKPYLCTGYDIYLVFEPCPMCAMALVHQRIRRIFFAFPNTNTGALGSVYRLQGEKSLNHHYAVFRVLLPQPVFDDNHS